MAGADDNKKDDGTNGDSAQNKGGNDGGANVNATESQSTPTTTNTNRYSVTT